MWYIFFGMWTLLNAASANYPVFERTNQLKELLIPADVHIGSVIYRLRASDSDHDYPLQFDATDYGSYVVRVENLACGLNSTYCEANVYLDRVLMPGQIFKFRFTVRDTKGDTTTAPASIQVTDAPVDITNIFPHLPGIIILPENTKVGTELEYVIVRRHPENKKLAVLEIMGSSVVNFSKIKSSQETTTGLITLKQSLDFEQQNMYKLQIFGLDMYADKRVDSRNIAGFEIILIVEDVQDTAPIFVGLEPTIKLRSNSSQGDVITKVTAIDGDKGNPRRIKYGLVSENNPFTIFFNIDRITGQITLAKPLKQLTAIARSHQPILLTILAEEEKPNTVESTSMSSTATIALLLTEAGNTPPDFDNEQYVCHLNENSPEGTALVFSEAYSTQVHDDDMGKQGVFSLTLEQNNGTFEISPNAVERKAYFTVRVRDKSLLDYESRQLVHMVIVARELDPGSLSSSATVLVYLNDINDNPPQFEKTSYTAQIPENVTANTFILEVKATDIDTGTAGNVHYTKISGFRNNSLALNSITGVISVASENHGFDREESSEYRMTVEARDMEGNGLSAVVPLMIRILDVNDETPTFENLLFHFTLTPDTKNFSTPAFLKATDNDAEPPNNVIRYEIISGNYNNKFALNQETGELTVAHHDISNRLKKKRQASEPQATNIYLLTVRAYDLGVPHRWSTAQVRILPPDMDTRLLTFLLPARGLNYQRTEELLTKITGGRVTIMEIRPYHRRYERFLTGISKPSSSDKNMVTARVTYNNNSLIDIEQVFHLLREVLFTGTPDTNKEEVLKAESGNSFFWILSIILLMLTIILIIALLCYLWNCFPAYNNLYKNKKHNRVSGDSEKINLRHKGIQVANDSSEMDGSAESNRRKRSWKFYHHREHEPKSVLLISKNESPVRYRNAPGGNENLTSYIYRTDLNTIKRRGDIFIQDIADTEYRILDPAKLNVRRLSDQFSAEIEKYGERNKRFEENRRYATVTDREETFFREGDAEILRLRTNDNKSEKGNRVQQYDDHFQVNSAGDIFDDGATFVTGIEKHFFTEEQSSQLEKAEGGCENVWLKSERIAENLEQKLQEEQQQQQQETEISASQVTEKVSQFHSKLPNGTVGDSRLKAGERGTIQKPCVVRQEKSNSTPTLDEGSSALTKTLDASQLDVEMNKLTLFQRDLLLTRFLVEEQRRFLNQTSDTLSLPGGLSLAPQTDRHRATQTDADALGWMRPEPRKAKSENDDSSDSEIDGKSKKTAKRFVFAGKDKRHKIRTPIIEETEHVDGGERSAGALTCDWQSRNAISKKSVDRANKHPSNGRLETNNMLSKLSECGSAYDVHDLWEGARLVLKDTKKSISFSNIAEACRVLSDKKVFTPRSLNSRIIARRLSGSQMRKIGSACEDDARKRDETKERRKLDRHRCAVEWIEKYEDGRTTARVNRTKLKHQKNVEIGPKDDGAKENVRPSSSSRNGIAVADHVLKIARGADNDTHEETETDDAMPTGMGTLKLKSKNQQLMEKKSVFAIAYDDATTEHLEASSNGSMHE